jgi:hypothetical protein
MSELVCRLDVFDPDERARYAALRTALRAETLEVQELADGYAVRLPSDPTAFRRAADWITLERRCCPFLALGLEWAGDDRVWLRLTGSAEVKTFLGAMLASRG